MFSGINLAKLLRYIKELTLSTVNFYNTFIIGTMMKPLFIFSRISLLLLLMLCGCQSMATPIQGYPNWQSSKINASKQHPDWQSSIDHTLSGLENEANDDTSAGKRPWSQKVEDVMMHALTLSGIDYKYGGDSPETGFDCSGFVQYVFQKAAQIALPRTVITINKVGREVSRNELQPGDLVFFNTIKSAISHVGIYLGEGRFIHAPRTGKKIRIENISSGYWSYRYRGAKRMDVVAQNQTR